MGIGGMGLTEKGQARMHCVEKDVPGFDREDLDGTGNTTRRTKYGLLKKKIIKGREKSKKRNSNAVTSRKRKKTIDQRVPLYQRIAYQPGLEQMRVDERMRELFQDNALNGSSRPSNNNLLAANNSRDRARIVRPPNNQYLHSPRSTLSSSRRRNSPRRKRMIHEPSTIQPSIIQPSLTQNHINHHLNQPSFENITMEITPREISRRVTPRKGAAMPPGDTMKILRSNAKRLSNDYQ